MDKKIMRTKQIEKMERIEFRKNKFRKKFIITQSVANE